MTAVAALSAALALTAGGVWLLRDAWARRAGGWRIAAGWALLALSVAAWRLTGAAWDKAAALAVLTGGVCGLAAAAAGADVARRSGGRRRETREAREVEPPMRGGPPWRAWARVVCAGPLALAAALGCAAFTALHGPGDAADRLVAAGFLTPAIWAAGGVWAITDDRLGRVAAALAGVAALAFAAARA